MFVKTVILIIFITGLLTSARGCKKQHSAASRQ